MGVICPCLPSFRLLLRRLLPRVLGTTERYEMDLVSNQTGALRSRIGGKSGLDNGAGSGGGGDGNTSATTTTTIADGKDDHVHVRTSIHVQSMRLGANGRAPAADGSGSQDGVEDTRSCASVTGLVRDSSDEESQAQGLKRGKSRGRS